MKPRWSVVAVVRNVDLFLALTRHFEPGDLNLPGAQASSEDASPDATLRRMLPEKTGVQARAFRPLTQWRGFFDEPVYAYNVTLWFGVPRAGAYGKALWTKPEYLMTPASSFMEKNRELIRKVQRRGKQ